MRKTHTSSAVKDRYNRKHYEQVNFRVAQGGRAALQELAELHGLSVNAYVRHLIIADGKKLGKPEISAILGGGGKGAEFYCGELATIFRELNGWEPFQEVEAIEDEPIESR